MNPSCDFTGQVALVTGASSGMGLATARAFAEAGAAVVLADINQAALTAVTDDLTAAGHQVATVACDVADEDQVAALVATTVETFGRLDMAFNNAGIQLPVCDAADEPAEAFDRVTAINLRGVWACMKHELKQMRSQGSGAIVNCSSLGGLAGNPGRAAYHATKHGVLGLTSSAALEYAPRGIRINAVCPGTIATPMVTDMLATGELDLAQALADLPINRLGEAEEIAAAVLCGVVSSPARVADQPAEGRAIDDRAAALAAHLLELVFHAGPHPAEVDRGHPVEGRRRFVGRVADRELDASVVERHIQAAERVDGGRDECGDLVLVSDIARHREHLVTGDG